MIRLTVADVNGMTLEGYNGEYVIGEYDSSSNTFSAKENIYDNDEIPWEVTDQRDLIFTIGDIQELLYQATGKQHTVVVEDTPIEKLRKELNMSRTELAIKLNIPIRTLEAWAKQSRKTPEWAEALIIEKMESWRDA